MIAEEIARLTAHLKFTIDARGLVEFEKKLQKVAKDAELLSARMEKALNKKFNPQLNTSSLQKQLKATAAMNKQQFQAQMQQSKFTLATEKTKTQLANEQTKQSTLQSRQALQQGRLAEQQGKLAAASNKAQQQHNMRAEVHAQKMQRQHAMTLAAEARSKTAIGRAEAWAEGQRQKAQAKAERASQRAAYKAGGMSGSHLPHLGGIVSGGVRGLGSFAGSAASMTGGMAGFEGLTAFSGLAGAAGGATMALGALAVAAAAASLAFAGAAERSANGRDLRLAQLQAMTGSKEGALVADQHFRDLADKLGISVADNGRDYAKVTGSLAKKMGVDRAEKTTGGILSYGKAQGMTSAEIGNMTRGILQALGKNQLYAEEWTGQISEHLGANANLYGAEAWQKTTGGKLTGDAAAKAFSDDRQNKKIVGNKLTTFLENLGKILQQHANDGGALDVATNTQESRTNRTQNHMDALLQGAWDADEGKLSKSVAAYTNAKLALLDSMGPAFNAFGSMAADTLDTLTKIMDTFTMFVHALDSTDRRFMEQFFNPAVMNEFKAAWDNLGGDMSRLFSTLEGVWSRIFGDTSSADIFSAILSGVADVMNVVGDVATLMDSMITKLIAVLTAAGLIKAPASNAVSQTNGQAESQTAGAYGGSEDVPQTPDGLKSFADMLRTAPHWGVSAQNIANQVTAETLDRDATKKANPVNADGTPATSPVTNIDNSTHVAPATMNTTINVTALPGMDAEQVANLVDEKFRNDLRPGVARIFSEYLPKEVH
ncbi:hypothetical protein [Pseudomonas syringae]|uniref:Uncharacterized protein n=1 Tax=Pseudomonas syringae TaxID=317 RepID=A0A085VHT9_PSESX|nr:hypothetical protein [Pseudomonas syringae]KFE55002.1 hypothetical protein IV02_02985 [Pseudomonas syringae]